MYVFFMFKIKKIEQKTCRKYYLSNSIYLFKFKSYKLSNTKIFELAEAKICKFDKVS